MFNFDKFLGDGAHDNNPTYVLLHTWNIKTIIPLNKKGTGNFKYTPPIKVDDDGFPICLCGIPMLYDYYDKVHHRIKWRCPYAKGKIQFCSYKDQCSPNAYGRTIYTKPEWDLRLFTAIPRGSKQWQQEMNKRTSSERVNKEFLMITIWKKLTLVVKNVGLGGLSFILLTVIWMLNYIFQKLTYWTF